MNRKYTIIIAILALISVSLLTNFVAGVAMASAYDGVSISQPAGSQSSPTPISGTYTFEAIMTVGSGEGYNVANGFVINGVAYTPTVTTVREASSFTEYRLSYGYVTGQLSNDEYGWYVSVTIGGTGYRSPSSGYDYFRVDNSFAVSFSSPSSGATISGITTVTISAVPTSTNQVSSAKVIIYGASFSLIAQGNNLYSGQVATTAYPNGVAAMTSNVTGTGSTYGQSTISVNINNAPSNKWSISYLQSTGNTYSTNVQPLMSSNYFSEGGLPFQEGSLPVYPNSLTEEVTASIPGTVPVQTLYFPVDSTPYYIFNTSEADNWTDPSTNHLSYSMATVANNSLFGTPDITGATTGGFVLNTTENFGPANISHGQWTIGFLFQFTNNAGISFGGLSYGTQALAVYSEYASGTSGPQKLYLDFKNTTSGTNEYYAVTNTTFTNGVWYSFAFTVNGLNSANIYSYKNLTIYVDGKDVGYTVQTVYSDSSHLGFAGFGTLLDNYQAQAGRIYTSFSDLFVSQSELSVKGIKQIQMPSDWQIYTALQPPLYSINETYTSVTLKNDSQPWSAVYLGVAQMQQGAFSSITLNLVSALGPQLFTTYLFNVSYTMPLSLDTFFVNPSLNIINMPLYSSVSVRVYNMWHQFVGESVFNVTQTSMNINIYLDLTQITFNVVNTIEGQVDVAANGITETAFASVVLANNSEYNFSMQAFVNGNSVTLYGAPNTTYSLFEAVSFYASAPAATVTILIYAYNESGLEQISTATSLGQPYVNLFIDGQRFSSESSYPTFLGQQLRVNVTDALNQSLYSNTLPVAGLSETYTVLINVKSWTLGMQNDEQAHVNSTLATETIRVTNEATGVNATFTNSVGQSLALYLVQGNYSLYLHDNATFHANVTLNQSEFYIIFGQQLLTLQEFNAKQNEIYNNTAHLMVTPVVSPVNALEGSPLQYQLNLQFPNDTSLNDSQTRQIVQNGTFAFYLNTNGTLTTQATLLAGSSSDVMAQLTISKPGSYNGIFLSFLSASGAVFSMRYSVTLQVMSLSNFSYGIKLSLNGPITVQVNHTAAFFILLTYSNGTALNYSDTSSAQYNITVTVYHDGIFIATLPVSFVTAGKLACSYTPLQLSSGYSIIVIVSPTLIGTAKASAESTLTFSAVNYNPTLSPGQDVLNSLVHFLSDSTNFIVITITIAGGLYGTYRFVRRRRIRLEQKLDALDSAVQGQIIAQNLTAEQRQAVIRAIPVKVKKKLVNAITGKEAIE